MSQLYPYDKQEYKTSSFLKIVQKTVDDKFNRDHIFSTLASSFKKFFDIIHNSILFTMNSQNSNSRKVTSQELNLPEIEVTIIAPIYTAMILDPSKLEKFFSTVGSSTVGKTGPDNNTNSSTEFEWKIKSHKSSLSYPEGLLAPDGRPWGSGSNPSHYIHLKPRPEKLECLLENTNATIHNLKFNLYPFGFILLIYTMRIADSCGKTLTIDEAKNQVKSVHEKVTKNLKELIQSLEKEIIKEKEEKIETAIKQKQLMKIAIKIIKEKEISNDTKADYELKKIEKHLERLTSEHLNPFLTQVWAHPIFHVANSEDNINIKQSLYTDANAQEIVSQDNTQNKEELHNAQDMENIVGYVGSKHSVLFSKPDSNEIKQALNIFEYMCALDAAIELSHRMIYTTTEYIMGESHSGNNLEQINHLQSLSLEIISLKQFATHINTLLSQLGTAMVPQERMIYRALQEHWGLNVRLQENDKQLEILESMHNRIMNVAGGKQQEKLNKTAVVFSAISLASVIVALVGFIGAGSIRFTLPQGIIALGIVSGVSVLSMFIWRSLFPKKNLEKSLG